MILIYDFELMLACFTLGGTLNALLERITRFLNLLPQVLPLMLPYFYWSFVNRCALLPDVLLHTLPYIFSEISTYLYHFQCVNIRYHQVFIKETYYYLF